METHFSIKTYRDVHTGSEFKERSGLQTLLKDIRQGRINTVLVWKIDRLSRNMRHLTDIVEIFNQHDVNFVSYSEDMNFSGVMGRFLLNMMGSIAELERETIWARTYSGRLASAKSGNYLGRYAPYGYRKLKRESGKGSFLEIEPSQARWVQKMFHWSAYDNMSNKMIAQKLNQTKVPYNCRNNENPSRSKARATKKKHPAWTERIIEKLLKNPIFMGKYIACDTDEQGKLLPENKWVITEMPAIVSPMLWHQSEEARNHRRCFHGDIVYLLSGKVIDIDTPQRRKFSGVNRTKGGHSYRRNQCKDTDGNTYPSFEIPAKPLEEFAWDYVLQALSNPDVFYDRYRQKQQDMANSSALRNQASSLQQQIEKIKGVEIPRIQSAFEEGLYDIETTKARLAQRRIDLQHKEKELRDIEALFESQDGKRTHYEKLKIFRERFAHELNTLTEADKHTLCNLIIDRIELSRSRTEGGTKKWDIQGNLVLNFGKALTWQASSEVRTPQAAVNKASCDQEADNCLCGEAGWSKTRNEIDDTGFVIPFKFKKWQESKKEKQVHSGNPSALRFFDSRRKLAHSVT